MTASPVGALSTSYFLGPRNFCSTEATVDPIVVEAGPTEFLRVPKAFLLDADFVRQGANLLLVSADGAQLLVRDYFTLSRPPALHTAEGAVLPADLVQSLAGPAAPAQYAQLEPQAIAAPIGRVATIDGTVTATRSDGSVVQLAVDAPVLQGDVLETGSNSRVGLVFNDDTTFALGENARMVLDEFIYDPSTHEGISAISVVKGVFVFVSGQIAAHNPEEMVVRTPTTVVGIRGTKVAGKAAAEGENSTFVLLPMRMARLAPSSCVPLLVNCSSTSPTPPSLYGARSCRPSECSSAISNSIRFLRRSCKLCRLRLMSFEKTSQVRKILVFWSSVLAGWG